MSDRTKTTPVAIEPDDEEGNPVTDIRRVREALDREVNGDIRKLAEKANAAGEAFVREKKDRLGAKSK